MSRMMMRSIEGICHMRHMTGFRIVAMVEGQATRSESR